MLDSNRAAFRRRFLIMSLLLAVSCRLSAADGGGIGLRIDNDVFVGTDRYYTNGFRLSWTSADFPFRRIRRQPCGGIESLSMILAPLRGPDCRVFMTIEFGQNMYTPDDITRTEVTPEDFPYAGMSFLEFGFHGRNPRRMDTLSLAIGVAGPYSLAEPVQKIVHKLTGSDFPEGWEYQIDNQVMVNMGYGTRRKLSLRSSDRPWGCDVIGKVSASLGNAFTGGDAGVEIRFGWNLPTDFGASPGRFGGIGGVTAPVAMGRSHAGPGLFAFAAGGGRIALYNFLFNTESRIAPALSERHRQGLGSLGLGLTWGRFRLSLARIWSTRWFSAQRHRPSYGSFSLEFEF